MSLTLIRTLFFGIALSGSPHLASAQQPSAAGLWEQVDETSGKPEGWLLISEEGGLYKGVLVKGFPSLVRTPQAGNAKNVKGRKRTPQ